MDFYPSKTNDYLNRKPFQPESIGGRVMVNPRYPIRQLARVAPWWCHRCQCFHTFPRVRCDSGAFQDVGKARLLPWTALEAQLRMERLIGLYLGDPTFHFEVIFIYDQMAGVDEAMVNGKKVKVRGTAETAARAVEETVQSAIYYATQRDRITGSIGFVGQGIDADQYIGCVQQMLPLMRPGDVFGFGGFCIWGRMPKRITPTAHETLTRVVPLLKAHGVSNFHLLGVMYAPGIEWTAALGQRECVTFATDGSGPEQAGCIAGRGYRQGRQVDVGYTKAHKCVDYHPCDLAHQNIRSYHEWSQAL